MNDELNFCSQFIVPCSSFPKSAYKPHSVGVYEDVNAGDHLSGSIVTNALLQPTRTSDGAGRSVGLVDKPRSPSPCLVLLPVGFAWPATSLPPPVVSYTTVSPSPAKRRTVWLAICLSVALAVGSPRPAVSRRRALWSADFPQPGARENAQPRSPSRLGKRIVTGYGERRKWGRSVQCSVISVQCSVWLLH